MKTSRPKDDGERDECITAATTAATTAGLAAVVVAALADVSAAEEIYLAARAAKSAADVTVAAERKAVRAADAAFGRAVRFWTSTVRTVDGKANPAGVAKIVGALPGRLVRMRPRDELSHTENLERRVGKEPSLAGDRAKLRGLVAARGRLARVVAAEEVASAARKAAIRALAAAEKAFDSAWSTAARLMRKKGPAEIASLVPVFVRVNAALADTSDGDGTIEAA